MLKAVYTASRLLCYNHTRTEPLTCSALHPMVMEKTPGSQPLGLQGGTDYSDGVQNG